MLPGVSAHDVGPTLITVRTEAARLWWLYGSPCAGKSVTAWQLHTNLLAGHPRAYFDVDQVGMCYPERQDDPDRHALKTRAAGALIRRLVAAGASTVVVSGVLDQPSMQALLAEETHGIAATFCRVRVDPEELTRRLHARYGPEDVQRALDEARAADEQADTQLTLDTASAPPADVAAQALHLLGSAPPATASTLRIHDVSPEQPPASVSTSTRVTPSPDDAIAILVCGPTGVGKSTTGFTLFSALADGDRTSSFLDLQQLSFLDDVPATTDGQDGHRLTAACVADVWQQHRAAGSRALVLTGHVETREDVAHYHAALGDVPLLVCRLRAGREALQERILERTHGRGPVLAGDELVGLDADHVQATVERSLTQQQRLNEAEAADVVVDTDTLDADEVAEKLTTLLAEVLARREAQRS